MRRPRRARFARACFPRMRARWPASRGGVMTADSLCVGHTPLLQVDSIWVKLECANPGGSVKDRIAVFMLREAMRRGELAAGDTVVEATSGNTGIALARVAHALGLRALLFMPEHMSPERLAIMERAGAEVVRTPRA